MMLLACQRGWTYSVWIPAELLGDAGGCRPLGDLVGVVRVCFDADYMPGWAGEGGHPPNLTVGDRSDLHDNIAPRDRQPERCSFRGANQREPNRITDPTTRDGGKCLTDAATCPQRETLCRKWFGHHRVTISPKRLKSNVIDDGDLAVGPGGTRISRLKPGVHEPIGRFTHVVTSITIRAVIFAGRQPAQPFARCASCGRVSGPYWWRWRAYRIDLPEADENPELAIYCQSCADRTFGPPRRRPLVERRSARRG